ncbi:MAG: D-glycero-alpha-D-manno-heptose-1,7-bisphosphate 7-phosphatase [Candidatus Aminicenantales bacterium]
MKRRAVFLDRDGTINRDVGYPDSYSLIEIYPYSFDAIRKINSLGFLAVIVTNQSGVGRGWIDEQNLLLIHHKMKEAFSLRGARIDGVYYCPHFADSSNPVYRKNCSCSKPHPGMGEQAARDLNIDTSKSYMIGDKVEDIQFGFNIRAIPILVRTGFGEATLPRLRALNIQPAFVAQNLMDAVNWIHDRERAGPLPQDRSDDPF